MAAITLHRRYLGIDENPEYVAIAGERSRRWRSGDSSVQPDRQALRRLFGPPHHDHPNRGSARNGLIGVESAILFWIGVGFECGIKESNQTQSIWEHIIDS